MAGRVPAHCAAILVVAKAGAELACRAHEMEFGDGADRVRRGIVSYYAAATLARATGLASWLDLMHEASRADAARGALPPFYRPALQIAGDRTLPLVGRPEGDGLPR